MEIWTKLKFDPNYSDLSLESFPFLVTKFRLRRLDYSSLDT